MRFSLPKLSLVVVVACIVALAALFYPPLRAKILSVEPWTADWRTVFLSDRIGAPYSPIVLVIINNKTLEGYKYTSPTPRDLIAKVVRAVDDAKPSVIGLDFYFIKPTDKDDELVATVRSTRAPLVIGAVDRRYPQFSAEEFAFQKKLLSATGRQAGYNELKHEKDDIVRNMAAPVDADYPRSFALLVAQAAKPTIEDRGPTRIAWLLGPGQSVDPFETISAEHLFQPDDKNPAVAERARELQQHLRDKIVLISGEYPYLDRHRTPLALWTGENALGVRIHANIVAQLLDGRRYAALDALWQEILLAGLILLGFSLGWFFWRRRVDFLSLTAVTIVLVVVDALTYKFARIVLPFTLAVWAWFISATLGHHAHTLWHAFVRRKSKIAAN